MFWSKIFLVVLAVLAIAELGSTQGRQARISVRIIEGSRQKVVPLDVHLSDTIASVKAKIERLERIPARRQTITFDGRVLEDRSSLANSGVAANSELRDTIRAATP